MAYDDTKICGFFVISSQVEHSIVS